MSQGNRKEQNERMFVKGEEDDNVNQKMRFNAMFPTTCSQPREHNFRHFFVAANFASAGRKSSSEIGNSGGGGAGKSRRRRAGAHELLRRLARENFREKASRGAARDDSKPCGECAKREVAWCARGRPAKERELPAPVVRRARRGGSWKLPLPWGCLAPLASGGELRVSAKLDAARGRPTCRARG